MKNTNHENKPFIGRNDVIVVLAILIIKTMFLTWFYIPSGSMLPTLRVNDRVVVDMDAYRYRLPLTDITLYTKGSPSRGDTIIFNESNSGLIYIKRVVGTAGDKVTLDEHYTLINDIPLEQELVSSDDNEHIYIQKNGDSEYKVRLLTKFDGAAVAAQLLKDGSLRNRNGSELEQEAKEAIKHYARLRTGEWTVPDGHVMVLGDNRDESLDSRFDEVSFVPVDRVRGRASFVLANMKPFEIAGVTIPFIPASFTDFNRSIYSIEANESQK